MTLGPESVLKRSPNVPWRSIDRKGILVDMESGHYFSLNSTGQYIWGQLDGARTLQEIAHRVAEHFDVDEPTALSDCLDLAKRLLDEKLAAIVPA